MKEIKDFAANWWENVGSGICPAEGEDREQHCRRVLDHFVAEILKNGSLMMFKAQDDPRLAAASREAAWAMVQHYRKVGDTAGAEAFLRHSAPLVVVTFDPSGDLKTSAVWAHDFARSLALLWVPSHIIGEGFWEQCLTVGERLVEWGETGSGGFVGFVSCFRGFSAASQFPEANVQRVAEYFMPFFNGERPLPEWVVERNVQHHERTEK